MIVVHIYDKRKKKNVFFLIIMCHCVNHTHHIYEYTPTTYIQSDFFTHDTRCLEKILSHSPVFQRGVFR